MKPRSRSATNGTATNNRRVVVLFLAANLLAALVGFGVPSGAQGAASIAPLYTVTDLAPVQESLVTRWRLTRP